MDNRNTIFDKSNNPELNEVITNFQQNTKDDWSNVYGALGKSKDLGFKMTKIKWINLDDWSHNREIENKKNLLISELSKKSGISIEDINEENIDDLVSRYENDDVIRGIMNIINKYNMSEKEVARKLNIERDKYNNLEQDKIRMINNIDNKALKLTTNLVSGVVQGVTDVENLAKNIIINYVTAGFGKAFSIGKYGVKGLEYGLDFIDNYLSMQRENKLINPDGKELTKKELVINSVAGLLVEGAFDGIRYGIKNIKGHVLGNTNRIVQQQAIDNTVNPAQTSLGNTSAKEILKESYDAEHGRGQANIDLYRQEVRENPDMVYHQELDPQNPHSDIYDNAYDYKLNEVTDNGEFYYKDGNEVRKIKIPEDDIIVLKDQLNKGLITKEEYQTMVDAYVDNFVYKIDNGIDIDAKVNAPKDYRKNRVNQVSEEPLALKEGDNLTTKEQGKNKYIEATEELKKSDYGDSTVVHDGDKTIYMYKDSNGNIITQTEDVNNVNKTVGNMDTNNHYLVRQIKDSISRETKIINKDGNVKSINGMQKIHFWGQLKRLSILPNVVKKVIAMGDDIQPNVTQTSSRKFSIKGIMTNWSIGRAVDILFMDDITNRWKNITSNNLKAFKELMVDENNNPFYVDIEDFLDDVNDKALIELFVKGDTDQVIFKTVRENNDLAKQQLKKWVNMLRKNDAFLQAYKNNKNFIDTDIDIAEWNNKYGKFLTIDDDGYIEFNTNKGAFFEGLDSVGISKKIIDLYINPEKIDLNMIDGIQDRDAFNDIFGNITLDEQNGIAISLAFLGREKDLAILKKFGFIDTNENGEIISSMEQFTTGLCNLISEISNPNTKYNPNKLRYILSRFYDMDILPKKIDIKDGNVVGEQSVNLLDFVFNNKSNSTIDMEGLHKVLQPIINNLGEVINKGVEKIKPITDVNIDNLKTEKIDFDNINKVVNILNRWKSIFNQDNKTNAYLLSDKFKKELEKVNKILGEINQEGAIPSKDIVNDIKAQEYNGKITFENMSEKIDPAIDGVIDAIDNHEKVVNDFYDIKDTIGRKRKIEAIVNSDDYKNKITNIEPKLKQLGVSEEIVNKLKSTDIKEVKEAFKEIDKIINDTKKENSKVYSNLHEFEELTTPESIAQYLKHTRNREKIQSVLDTMEKYGIDKDTIQDIRDFINFHGKEYDYKLDKDNIINNVNTILSEIDNLKGQLNVGNYGERITAYKELLSAYEELNKLVRGNTGKKSVMFIQNKDIGKLYDKIKKNSEIVGENVDELLEYEKLLDRTQKILGEIQESNRNSPLNKLNKDFVGGYKSSTTTEAQNFGILEMLINKGIWLNDRRWFKTTKDKKIMKVLFSQIDGKKIETIHDVPEGAVEKLIDKKYLRMFQNLYDFAVDKFKQAEILDKDGNVISSTPLTLDQFVFVYGKFLDELNKTKRSNKRQSIGALKSFFKDENSMFEFFTQRKKMYGTGYVKDNADAITLFNEINSMEFAEISKLGMTITQFANKLNPNNRSVKNIVNNELASETINGETVKKENKEIYDKTFRTIAEYLRRTKQKKNKGLIGYVDENITSWVDKGLDVIYPILLNCTGLIENFMNDIFAVHRTTYMDANGKMFGYKSNNRVLAPFKQYGAALGRGIVKGTLTVPAVVFNGFTGVTNTLLELDRYFFLQKMINLTTGKDMDWKIKTDMTKRTITNIFGSGILSKLTGADRAVVKGVLDAYISKKFMKGKYSNINPNQLKFRGHKLDYIKQGFSSALDVFTDSALSIQEISDMTRDICASIRSNYLMEELMSKKYIDLPEQIIGQLKSFGIDEANYINLQQSISKLADDNGKINIFLRDLFGQIDDNEILQNMDKSMLGAIEGLANHFHETAFTLNKNHKYSIGQQDALSKIMFALRHSTLGMASEDVINLLYDETASGVYQAKYKRFKPEYNIQKNLNIAGNSIVNSVPSFVAFTLATTGAITVGTLMDDISRKFSDIRRDIAERRAELQVAKDILQSDTSAMAKTGSLLYYSFSKMSKNILQAVPLQAFVNKGNIFQTYQDIAGEFYVALWETFKDPHEINEKEFNKHLDALGIKRNYSKGEHLNKMNSIPLISAMGTAIATTYGKIPYGLYKSISLKNDYQHRNDVAEKLKRYNDEKTGAYAADIYLNMFGAIDSKEPQDDELVQLPPYDNLNDKGKELVGTAISNTYINLQEQILNSMEVNNVQTNNALNQFAYKNNIYDDTQYKDKQMELYKYMELDKKIEELPYIYQMAIDDVESTYDNLNELDKNELRLLMLNKIQDEELTPNQLINMFSKDEKGIDNIYNNEIQKKDTYSTIDELPYIYQMYYDDMLNQGQNISEKDVIELANSGSPIPEIKKLEQSPKLNIEGGITDNSKQLNNNIENISIKNPELNINPKTNINNNTILQNINQEHQNKNKDLKGINTIKRDNYITEKLSKAFSVAPKDIEIDVNKLSKNLKDKINNSIEINDDRIKEDIVKELSDTPILNEEYKEPKNTLSNNVKENISQDKKPTKKLSVQEQSIKNINDILVDKKKNKNAGVISIKDYYNIVNKDKLPKQLKLALSEFEKHPITGDKNVKSYFKKSGFGNLNANNNWCAAFLTSMYTDAGFKLKEKTVAAQAFAKNGKEVSMNKAQIGDTLVFRNRDKNGKRTWTGHVNMIAYIDDSIIVAIGGNQSEKNSNERDDKNTINLKVYDRKELNKKIPNGDLSIIHLNNN